MIVVAYQHREENGQYWDYSQVVAYQHKEDGHYSDYGQAVTLPAQRGRPTPQ